LIARTPEPLAAAAVAVAASAQSGAFVQTLACDATDLAALQPALEAFIAQRGAPDYLFNAVGYAYPQDLHALTLADFERNMHANYYGQLAPTLALLPHFRAAGKGHIINISSILGFIAAPGYATYTPSKYALFGLSEALRSELRQEGIRVSVAFPPDTDTPGFAEENRTKPPAVARMSSNTNKLLSPEAVAAAILRGVAAGRFEILVGDARWMRPVSRIFPGLARRIIDQEYAKALKQVAQMRNR
ncbi:MAG: SDR family NAD(P)-dependent oxidoreductase, partial [Caldilineales bacterium]|nr:SDR family NAD(P)-dependent oxidoreductase [Caldilineales bacterium]